MSRVPGAQENPRLPEQAQHVVETPAESTGNAELTGSNCPTICPTLVKERPILFSGEMVRAILAGNKTQTRRVVKPQPPSNVESATHNNARDAWFWWDNGLTGDKFECPYGKVGDRLWVRESWCRKWNERGFVYNSAGELDASCVHYRADGYDVLACDGDGYLKRRKGGGECSPWTPSIHMPRWASRILLEITDVRVERLQDISEADAIAEGCVVSGSDGKFSVPGPVYRYEQLWDSINGKKHPWASNPWVWVIAFKKVPQ